MIDRWVIILDSFNAIMKDVERAGNVARGESKYDYRRVYHNTNEDLVKLFNIKIIQCKHFIFWKGLATNLVRLPGTNVDLRGILVSEVPKQEQITFIVISITGPTLKQSNSIEIGIDRVTHDFNLIKCHFLQ